MNRRKIDVAFTSLLIIVSLVILSSDKLVEGGMETDLGSLFLPRIVAVFIILFSVMIGIPSLAKLLKNAPLGGLERIDTTGFLGIGIYIAILVAYWAAIPHVGFLIATPIAMFSIAVLLEGRNWPVMAAVSVLTPLAVYYGSSTFLRVFLPTWSLS
ncbi:tripartite tricarboxylate transporter TctB family protein [Denitromonas ohlonensis]|uniref:Tripartite tricarboxylate transporter TctB family protein n=2 Tax=Denitromonas TaxID=139331 RepID=A0A558C8L8_9RHOO|nr:tripartite tricarboxylate transporter TctB family protein [Denitromonas ohlonensis]TVO63974.1 tripartite tricarboxylate transporter TctB family protein [Denitromonas ohlonensis]TVO73050.1 tripartite tricarboxylate transporter TctB family protein [Denitromonas ohlonensis]TVT45131.1 MAG: tripartite tricarboxylate transporter TctB family protein [Denitromonas halophila]TVT70507.1 MAG: tripartite tricarboxylate transporter TctB family protein [Denitromonas halophila]